MGSLEQPAGGKHSDLSKTEHDLMDLFGGAAWAGYEMSVHPERTGGVAGIAAEIFESLRTDLKQAAESTARDLPRIIIEDKNSKSPESKPESGEHTKENAKKYDDLEKRPNRTDGGKHKENNSKQVEGRSPEAHKATGGIGGPVKPSH